MAKGIVIYFSKSGNTKNMAETIAEAMNQQNLTTECKSIEKTTVSDLLENDVIVIGSPTYYGHMAAPITQLLDDSVAKHGKLTGKIGAAFTSSANIGGGNETTIIAILQAMLIHGMIIQGDAQGDHYGPVSIGRPDDRVTGQCQRLGKKLAGLAEKLYD